MSDDLILYTHPMSRGRTARWMLEETGVPYRAEIIDYGPVMKGAAYCAINPMGKVPALRHGSTIVTECAAICAYLADAFPAANLAPAPGSAARGSYYRWMFFAAGPLEQATTAKAIGWTAAADKEGMIGFGTYKSTMDALEAAVSQGDYVLGDTFSAADVYLGAHIDWGLQFGSVEKRPAFERYCQRLASRPARLKAEAIDNALAAAHPIPGMN